ncbi:MAG: efflux RND transporter periplasmic adaptor subunit [Verrucomicrobiota bacterium]
MDKLSSPSPAELSKIISANKSASGSRWIIWLLVIAALAGAGFYAWSKSHDTEVAPFTYTTEPVKRGEIKLTVTATGNLEPTTEVTIGSMLSGNAGEVYVDINDRVKKGQELAKIIIRRLDQDTDNSRAALNASQAKVKQVEATVMESEAALERQQELHKLSGGRTPSKADMVTATAAAARAKADLGSAQAAVEQAKASLEANMSDQERAVLRSPIDGVVLKRSLEPGQTVAASFNSPELFVIAENLEHMKLKVAVAEADIGRVAAEQKASFTVDAWPDRSYSAKVTRVSFGSAITDNVVTYETELEVANPDLSLRPGMTATADIHVAEGHDVLLVPVSALRFDPHAASEAPRGGPPGGAGGEKKSFVQSLIPSPSRRGGSGGPRGDAADHDKGSDKAKSGRSQVWILRDGQPVAVPVKLGISDGRLTEVTGEGLSEGTPVIVRASSNTPKS